MEVDGAELQPLVDIRAGQLVSNGGVMSADPQKGLLRIAQSEDTLTHVLWFKREGTAPAGEPVHDIVVFPGECSLKEIAGQPRCYMLTFPEDPSRNLYFWMQGGKAVDDNSLISAFNAALDGQEVHTMPVTSPVPTPADPRPAQQAVQAGGPADLASILSSALSAAGAGPAAHAPDATALAASLLSQLAAQHGQQRVMADQGPGLHEVLKPELVVPFVQRAGVLEQLAQHLPEQHRTLKHLVATVRSPQFQQQVAQFSMALQTGQLDVGQFGLQAKGFSVADFLEAVQEAVDKEKAGQGTGGSA